MYSTDATRVKCSSGACSGRWLCQSLREVLCADVCGEPSVNMQCRCCKGSVHTKNQGFSGHERRRKSGFALSHEFRREFLYQSRQN